MHRGVIDDADIVLLAEWQDRCLNRPVQHGVRRLVRGDRSDLHHAPHLIRAEVRDADPTNFALPLQVRHHTPGFFDLLIRLGPMHLVKIDDVYTQAAKAVLCLAANVLQTVADLAFLVPDQAAFSKDEWLVRSALERSGNHLLGMPQAIYRCSVNPVDTKIQGLMDGSDRILIVLRPPGKLPAPSPDPPGSEAH